MTVDSARDRRPVASLRSRAERWNAPDPNGRDYSMTLRSSQVVATPFELSIHDFVSYAPSASPAPRQAADVTNVSSRRVQAAADSDFETIACLPSREDRHGPGGLLPFIR